MPTSPYNCTACGEDVRYATADNNAKVVKVDDDTFYHMHCFSCRVCKADVQGGYHHHNGKLLCPEHFAIQNSGCCKFCYGKLTPEHPTVSISGGKYHTKCTSCALCNKPVTGGEEAVPCPSNTFVHKACLVCQHCGETQGKFTLNLETRACECTNSATCLRHRRQSASSSHISSNARVSSTSPTRSTPVATTSPAVLGEGEEEDIIVRDGAVNEDELPLFSSSITPLVGACAKFLSQKRRVSTEGLFRVPGEMAKIHGIAEDFRAGTSVDLEAENATAHTVAGILKLFLRGSPPHFSSALSQKVMLAVDSDSVKDRIASLRKMDRGIDLGYVIRLLQQVVDDGENRMGVEQITTAMGPSLFPALSLQKTRKILSVLIGEAATIYPDIDISAFELSRQY